MTRRVLILAVLAAVAQCVVAVGSYAMVVLAAETGWPIFAGLGRSLIFADVPLYFRYANRAFGGEIPYRDYLVEYPPLALPFLFAPRAFVATQSRFVLLFAVEMLACHALTVLLVARRVADEEGVAALPGRLVWHTVAFAGIAPWAMGRFDAVPALVGFLAAELLYGGRPGVGGGLAGVGVLIKIAPGATILPALVASRGRPGRALIAFCGMVAVGVLGWWGLGGPRFVAAIRYHTERGIEIGSIPAGLLALVARACGWPCGIEAGHGSSNLVAPGARTAAQWGGLMQLLLMGLVAIRGFQVRGRDPIPLAGLSVLAFAIGGKVLSPQYLLWFLPFVATLTGPSARTCRGLFLIASLLTGVLYPWTFEGLIRLEFGPVVLLNLRNLALLALGFVWLRNVGRVHGVGAAV